MFYEDVPHMNSRERVERAISHRESDRVPVDFGGCVVTSIDQDAHMRLAEHLGFSCGKRKIIDYTMGTVEPAEEIMRFFHSDVRRVGMNVSVPDFKGDTYYNGFGVLHRKASGHLYYDVIENPLRDYDLDELVHMQMPDPDNPALYHGLANKAKELYNNSEYAIFADFGVPGFFETCQKLRGYEQFACDLLLEPELVKALFDRLLELQKRFFKNYLSHVGRYAVAVGYADDLGMQDRPQISPEIYRNIIKPYHKEIFRYIHDISDVKIMLHSCGAIIPLMDDLLDAGVDIFNPVQTAAAGMDPAILKARFGKNVVFWGGIDEQMLLPYGTPEEIRDGVRSVLQALGEGGGYVAAVSHNIQSDTPPENIEVCFEALQSEQERKQPR